ncbi:type II secretion system protein [Marichromatium bheemlicum]|uniref:Type II secretion system protein n=1 Tax=Marichromatium bheemlicum TaxID=365339 RepID=A0ABX1I5D0_9GAMM|nr:type II secretion system protein [Marichromatium bheemlicum]
MTQKEAHRGFSLIELSISMVALGAIIMVVVALLPSVRQTTQETQIAPRIAEVHNALEGFAFVHARLPWADTDGNGKENDGAMVGRLPYIDLGLGQPLRNAWQLDFRYAVYAKPGTADKPTQDTELPVRKDRFYPYIAAGHDPVGGQRALGHANSLDFCWALGSAQSAKSIDARYLHVVNRSIKEHVAYALIDPGARDRDLDGSVFDGLNSPNDAHLPMGFEHPSTATTFTNDDHVHVRYFNELRERLGCTGVIAATGHAHPNIETTLVIFQRAADDYLQQLKISKELAENEIIGASADIAAAASGMAGAIASFPTSIASSITTAGATSSAIALASGAIVVATGAAVDTAIALTKKKKMRDDIDDRIDELEDLIDNHLKPLYQSVSHNVLTQDQHGVYDDHLGQP